MGKSSYVFLRMSEEHYMSIPNEIRERFLASKRVDEGILDFDTNIKDTTFKMLYDKVKESKKELSDWQFYLREERRKLK